MKSNATTPEKYIGSLGEPRRSHIAQLDKVIQSAVPQLKREMGYGIGYGPYHYKYASGREGNAHVITLTSQKNYISIYIQAGKDDHYLPELYKARLPKASIGKSCIRFKSPDDIDQQVLTDICQEAAKIMKPKLT